MCPPVRVVALGLAVLVSSAAASAQQDVIVAIRVQGNTLTPDDEIIRISGLTEDAPFADQVLAAGAERLRATKRFERVEVLKRDASIADPSRILILIRVDEGPVQVVPGTRPGQAPRVSRRRKLHVMFAPILNAEDGYGLTYGGQLAVSGNSSTTSRVLFPLSWGGDKRAGVELQKEFGAPLAPRATAGAFVERRTHPFFHSDADKTRVWGRAEWKLLPAMRAGAELAWQKATLLDRSDRTRSLGADVVVDTRRDPFLPRNAVYARAAVERLNLPTSRVRTELEGDGYLGLYRATVLVLRARREDMSRSAPPFFKSILGGSSNLRGFRAGTAIGDTLVAGSAELRIPLTSPFALARFGTNAFVDVGTTYDKGQRFRDERLKRGVGGGIWATVALLRLSFMVAHGIGSGTRVHFGVGLTF